MLQTLIPAIEKGIREELTTVRNYKRSDTTYFVQYRIYLGLTQGIGENAGHAVKGKMIRDARAVVDRFFESYTIFNGKGVWKGQRENTKVFEIVSTNDAKGIVMGIAEEIRDLCNQACVMVTDHPVDCATV